MSAARRAATPAARPVVPFDSALRPRGRHGYLLARRLLEGWDMGGFGYPVTLALTARRCLVVGGGAVAECKVEGLVDAGARVTVVSPWLSRALLDLAADGRFAWWPREYAVGDAGGFFLAIVATDDRAVNLAVAAEARARGVLVHCADDPALSDFTVASSVPSVSLAVVASATAPSALPPRHGSR